MPNAASPSSRQSKAPSVRKRSAKRGTALKPATAFLDTEVTKTVKGKARTVLPKSPFGLNKRKLFAQFRIAIDKADSYFQAHPKERVPENILIKVSPDGEMVVTLPSKAEETVAPQQQRSLEDALADARARGRLRVAEILSAEDMINAEDFGKLLGMSRVTVNAKRASHELLGLEGPKRGYRFPRWQLDADGRPFAVFPQLFAHLSGDPWSVYRLLVQRHDELNGLTGREALLKGDSEGVLNVAENMSQGIA